MSLQPPDGYRFHTPIAIRYGDMDTLGHVNNANYLTYFEQARVGYCRALGLWTGGQSPLGLILARIVIDYRLPLTLDDDVVDIWTRCAHIGNKSMALQQCLTCQRDGQTMTAADCASVVVAFDYVQNGSVRVPDTWRGAVTAYEPLLEG